MIRVLIVDDSPLAQEMIAAILSTDPEISIVGKAADGMDAVQKVRELKPDIVTMDIEMPVMDGLEAIEKIMALNAVPILVVTTRSDAKTAYAAISKGALDLIPKPDIDIEGAHEFISRVKLLSKIKVITHIKGNLSDKKKPLPAAAALDRKPLSRRVVAIAASTGGPDALSVILSNLPAKFPCPVVVAQHMSDGFVSGMVEWLKTLCKVNLKVASEGDTLSEATVYVAPPEMHMQVTKSGRVVLLSRAPKDIYRPSCDVLLSSVADSYGAKSIGIILTGMGSDGVVGMKKIKEAGGVTIAQDEKTSIVFGMPKLAIESRSIDKVLAVGEISGEIIKILSRDPGLPKAYEDR